MADRVTFEYDRNGRAVIYVTAPSGARVATYTLDTNQHETGRLVKRALSFNPDDWLSHDKVKRQEAAIGSPSYPFREIQKTVANARTS